MAGIQSPPDRNRCMQEEASAQEVALPHLIVQVETTVANVQDVEMTATIEEELA
jgi:hypothetical protein